MDSLKVSGTSFASQVIVFMDMLPYFLGIAIAVMNIIYLYYKIRNEKESQMLGKVVAQYLLDDEVKADLIASVNKSVNVPMINEKTEAKILEAIWELFEMAIKKKLGV